MYIYLNIRGAREWSGKIRGGLKSDSHLSNFSFKLPLTSFCFPLNFSSQCTTSAISHSTNNVSVRAKNKRDEPNLGKRANKKDELQANPLSQEKAAVKDLGYKD